jgi:hypothetical protein
LINFFTPARICHANFLNDLGGAEIPASDRLGNKERLLLYVQDRRFMGSQM